MYSTDFLALTSHIIVTTFWTKSDKSQFFSPFFFRNEFTPMCSVYLFSLTSLQIGFFFCQKWGKRPVGNQGGRCLQNPPDFCRNKRKTFSFRIPNPTAPIPSGFSILPMALDVEYLLDAFRYDTMWWYKMIHRDTMCK